MKHIFQLTWLRGAAAFFVICSHALRASEVNYGPGDLPSDFLLFRLLDLGTLGVMLFFTLSGATLYLTNGTISNRSQIGCFFIKRIFRIWPAYVVSLIVYIGFNKWFETLYLQSIEAKGYWIEQHLREYGLLDLLKYLLLLFDFPETRDTLFNGAYWSLPIEFHYYILFPLICYILCRVGIIGVIGCGTLMLGSGLAVFLYYDLQQYFLICAYTFLGGVILGRIFERESIRMPSWLSLILILAMLCLSSMIRNQLIPVSTRYHLLIDGVLSVGVVGAGLFSLVKPTENLMGRLLTHYGKISYSTYLFHQIFIASSVLLAMKYGISGNYKYMLIMTITICGALILSSLSFKYIENPWITFSRKLIKQKQ